MINGDSTIRLRFSHRCSDLEDPGCDSQIALPIQDGEDVLIRRRDYHTFNLIHPKDYSYFNTLSTKARLVEKIVLIFTAASLLDKTSLYCTKTFTVLVFHTGRQLCWRNSPSVILLSFVNWKLISTAA